MPDAKKERWPKFGTPKPISTSSPAGLAAAQMVTPDKLSSLLLEKGPLAIRHITQTLGTEIPSFKDLSSSKQRRLIMSAMETGDQKHSVVFEKIGWGQWTAKPVAQESFLQEREATNIANAKVKDMVSQESQRRRSSNGQGTKPSQLSLNTKKASTLSKPALTASPPSPQKVPSSIAAHDDKVKQEQPQQDRNIREKEDVCTATSEPKVLYIDENALASDDEDELDQDNEEDEEDEDFLKRNLKEEEDEDNLYSFRRRKSSVVWADHTPESMEHELLARRVRPFLNGKSRRSSSKIRTSSVSKPSVHLDLPQTTISHSQQPRPRNGSNHMIDLEQITNSISEPTSRRESRVSFSKESSMRSTLLPHKGYLWLNSRQDKRNVHYPHPHRCHRSKHWNGSCPGEHAYSDTDEEDWASIGAASLRINSVPPKMDMVSTSSNGFVAPANSNDSTSNLKENEGTRIPARSTDDNKAAFLLMSLKS